jgi:hypothetical protein
VTGYYRLHSGGVVRNGVAALLIGPSGVGKSTLVVRLVSDGFGLLSDDEVWIDPISHLAHPSGRSLLLKESAWDLFPDHRDKFVSAEADGSRSWWLSGEDLRPGCRALPSRIGGLILLDRTFANAPVLEQIGQAEVVSSLLKESMNFPEFGQAGLNLLVDVTNSARLFRLRNGDLNRCAEMLSRALP